MIALRCGRIDPHPEHVWKTPESVDAYTCTGYVLTEGAFAEYAREQDALEAQWEADQAARRDAEAVDR